MISKRLRELIEDSSMLMNKGVSANGATKMIPAIRVSEIEALAKELEGYEAGIIEEAAHKLFFSGATWPAYETLNYYAATLKPKTGD